MNSITRRDLLKALLSGAASTAGAVVLARATLAAEGQAAAPTGDVQQRADHLTEEAADGLEPVAFLNGAFRNGGGFRNGAFRNGGGFRNGAFRNGGGFRNGGFANGGFRNGGFVNGGFRNGGFRNGSFRNW
jgi:hypothetical protein